MSNVSSNDLFLTWNTALAVCLENLGSPMLPEKMDSVIHSLVPHDRMMIFGYRSQGRPLDLYNAGSPEYRNVIVDNYIAGRYRLDPFYHLYQQGTEDRFYSLREITSNNFQESEYYLSHYAHTGIFDEVVVYIKFDSDLTAAVSLTRHEHGSLFSDSEINMLDRMIPVIHSILRRYWLNNDSQYQNDILPSCSLKTHIKSMFQQFGQSLLTKRENEIISLILSGYSSKKIGVELGISEGTVKIHRKNAYQKLNVSKQSELFSLFLSTLSDY